MDGARTTLNCVPGSSDVFGNSVPVVFARFRLKEVATVWPLVVSNCTAFPTTLEGFTGRVNWTTIDATCGTPTALSAGFTEATRKSGGTNVPAAMIAL